MRDGVRLAISLYHPEGADKTAKRPTILYQTRYGRATHFAVGQDADPERWRRAGFVVAVVDTRGSTASFGLRDVDIGPDEVRDMDELIDHLAARPWSNGRVIATGVSYMADTADWATGRPRPALLAAIPRQADFDTYLHLFNPGGVANDYFMNAWGEYTREIDLGRDGDGRNQDCLRTVEDCPKLFPVLQPVDEDGGFALLREALAGRRRWGPETYSRAEFRDDRGLNGYAMFASSPASALADIRRERKPVQYWGSWMDAGTAESALARYRSAPEVPMEIWITANDHSHTTGADPLRPAARRAHPSPEAQFELTRRFAERVLAGEPIPRVINYVVLGTETFQRTPSWPPADARPVRWRLTADRALSLEPPVKTAMVSHVVDFTTGTGRATRWTTQFGTPPAYPDRRDADTKLLTFDSPPFPADTEVTGTPVVNLRMASQSSDPAVFVYLEDVAPDGRVTYLGEGVFRAVNRKLADPAALPYDQGPAPHSFRRGDALAVEPGRMMDLTFAMFPFAALIRRGHRLRFAVAGADADTFRRYSNGEADVFTIAAGGPEGSYVEVTARPWRA